MSKAGKFVKKHPWEAAGAAAALGLGGAGLAGAGPLAGMLGAGAAPAVPEAGAALAGASGLADLTGATGMPLASTPSVMPPADWKGGLKGLAYANKASGMLGAGQQQSPPSMGGNPYAQNTPPTPTVLPSLAQAPGQPTLEELLRRLQQGGMA